MLLVAEPCSHPVKKEPAEPECPAPVPTDIQLLPQQAGMASILASAVINSECTASQGLGLLGLGARGLQLGPQVVGRGSLGKHRPWVQSPGPQTAPRETSELRDSSTAEAGDTRVLGSTEAARAGHLDTGSHERTQGKRVPGCRWHKDTLGQQWGPSPGAGTAGQAPRAQVHHEKSRQTGLRPRLDSVPPMPNG